MMNFLFEIWCQVWPFMVFHRFLGLFLLGYESERWVEGEITDCGGRYLQLFAIGILVVIIGAEIFLPIRAGQFFKELVIYWKEQRKIFILQSAREAIRKLPEKEKEKDRAWIEAQREVNQTTRKLETLIHMNG